MGRVIEDRLDRAWIIDSVMAEERLVLGRDKGVDHERRDLVVGQVDSALASEGLDRLAVVAADVGRQRRLIGEQLLGRGQARCKIEPHPGDQDEQRKSAPGQPAEPAARPQWVDALVHSPVEGDQVRKLPGRGGQSVELHSRQRLAASGRREKLRIPTRDRVATSASIAWARASTIALRCTGSRRSSSSSALLM